MNKISSIVIDDEFLNRKLISMMVTRLNEDFEVNGEAENIRDGFSLIEKIKPQVVFLDIKMPDGSGFDLLRKFAEINFEVVFITGFDEYALQAFEFNALDYVLKPIDMDKFKLTLDKVQKRVSKTLSGALNLQEIIQAYAIEDAIITKIPVHYHNKVVLLSVDDIMYVQADSGSTVFTTRVPEQYPSSKQLSDFEFILDTYPNFVKIRKNILININYMSSYSKGFTCYVTMNDGLKIEIPRRKKAEILKLLSKKRVIS